MARPEIFVSTDIEADGPLPGANSMLSLGSAAFLADKTRVGSFEVNLAPLPGAAPDPATMDWWHGHPEAWQACHQDPQPPAEAMRRYAEWIAALPGRAVFVGYPACFDFLFVHWYLVRFTGSNPFTHSALDIRSYAMATLGVGFREATKRNMPERWFDAQGHTHRALDDALEQGALFCNMLRERLSSPEPTREEEPVSHDDERLTNVEVKFDFIEKTVEDLDSVVRDLNREVQELRREVERLRGQVSESGGGDGAAPRKLEDDIPPHY